MKNEKNDIIPIIKNGKNKVTDLYDILNEFNKYFGEIRNKICNDVQISR